MADRRPAQFDAFPVAPTEVAPNVIQLAGQGYRGLTAPDLRAPQVPDPQGVRIDNTGVNPRVPTGAGGAEPFHQPPGVALPQLPNVVGAGPIPPYPVGAMPPLPAVLRHVSYSTLYSDAERDPFRHSYGAILNRFDAMVEEPVAAETLLEMTLGNPTVPLTFLCCSAVHNPNTYKIYLVHTLSKYVPALDGRATPWDNRYFCFLGDVLTDTAITVAIPGTAFAVTAQAFIYNDETLAQELVTLPENALFPRQVNNANTMAMRTRYLMYLPPKYAHLMLDNKGCSPKEAWNRLIPAFQADDFLDAAAPIVNWIRASLHATQANHRGPPITALTLASPIADQDLVSHRSTLLFQALPALRHQQDPGLNTALVQMAHAVASQANEAQTARLARELERDQPTLPSTKFSLLFPSLKRYLGVEEEAQLPEFWFSLASAKKKQEFSVVKEALEAYSRSNATFYNLAPVPTPKLVSDLVTVNFVADHPDDLKTGIQPFTIMDGSEEYRTAAQSVAERYTMLAGQDFAIQYNDLEQFKVPKDIRAHPITFFELEKSLGLFGNLMAVVLGEAHPLTVHYRLFWASFTRQFRNQLHYEIDVRRIIKPVHILRNIQLITFHWFQAARAQLPNTTPPFQDILTRISLSLYQNPNLPPALYQLIMHKHNPKTLIIDPTSDKDDASTATGLSTLTPGTSLSKATTTPSLVSGRSGNFVRNPAVDSALQSLLPTGVKINDLLGSDPVPTGDDNNPFCLAYHIRGGCFTNCRRKASHDKALSAKDKQQLSNWLVDQTAKLRARFTSG